MSEPLPIACTLSAPDLGRVARSCGRSAPTGFWTRPRRRSGGAPLPARSSVRERVEAIVAAEAECCAFLDFRVEHGDEATVLTISAPNGGAEVVHELAAALAGR